MFALYEAGAFGNKFRTWRNLIEYYASDYMGTVSLRYKGSAGGGLAHYNVSREDVPSFVRAAESKGFDLGLIAVNESAPDSRLLIQGEVFRTELGLSLFWSKQKTKMRTALQKGIQTYGFQALFLLKQNLTTASYEDLQDLLDCYDGAVIEFSAYDMCIGNLKHRNTVIWEVRNY